MADEKQDGGFSDRPMFQGDWKCAKCDAEIKELPFEPAEGRDLFCKECYSQEPRVRRSPRPMVQGKWECAGCKKKISELPFQPSGDRPIYCLDCYRSNR